MKILLILLMFFCLSSCNKNKEVPRMQYKGNWKGSSLVIGDSVSTVDLTPVKLNLKENSRYEYINNIGQMEAGTYFVRDSLLITMDTTVSPSKETAVHIIKAENDSLLIRMNMSTQEAVMYFVK